MHLFLGVDAHLWHIHISARLIFYLFWKCLSPLFWGQWYKNILASLQACSSDSLRICLLLWQLLTSLLFLTFRSFSIFFPLIALMPILCGKLSFQSSLHYCHSCNSFSRLAFRADTYMNCHFMCCSVVHKLRWIIIVWSMGEILKMILVVYVVLFFVVNSLHQDKLALAG